MAALLPELVEVEYYGWHTWQQIEEDVWVEAAALRRLGWSSVRWRLWMKLLQEEVARRSVWWQLVEQWRLMRWGGVTGGGSPRNEMVWEAMRDEEAARRLIWNWEMRWEGWGGVADTWLEAWGARFFEWGLEEEVAFCREAWVIRQGGVAHTDSE